MRDLVALGDASAEVVHGVIVYKAEPSDEPAMHRSRSDRS
jgi:hypothetical protein